MIKLIKRLLISSQHRQLFALKLNINILKWLINYFNYKGDILIRKNECFVGDEGVFLNIKATNRYLKSQSLSRINQGFYLYEKIKKILNQVNIVIDIGANVGEVSIFLSKMIPNSKIFSIEPSKRNLLLFKENIQKQFFNCNNIKIIEKVVCNYNGKIKITKLFGAENTIILDPKKNRQINNKLKNNTGKIEEVEEVDANTLLKLCEENKINEIDFIKIDIEGSEPLLTEDINKLKPKIIFTEISDKNTEASYQEMLNKLKDNYKIYDNNLQTIDNIRYFISNLFNKKVSIYNISVTDIWLIRKDINFKNLN
ncbi:FkbM family methyltransferase [Candidatus Pelagibacter sp. HIMB1495]|uniref:FkbM family methyltransferase n=1 Tax=unclassified Candidatus Pelagibacter TaxID=2647897 RepID=UPI003F86BFA5